MGLFDLTGKRALVTGGAQGMGRMIAEGLLRAGASVAITSRKADIAEQAARGMSELGSCRAYSANLESAAAAVDLAQRYAADHDGLDILVNNAGKTWGGPIESFPDSAWAGVMAVNVQTPFTLVHELLPLLEPTIRPGSSTSDRSPACAPKGSMPTATPRARRRSIC